MPTQIIQVPYDSGRRSVRMGKGPAYILSHAGAWLRDATVDSIEVEEQPFELGTTLRVLSSVSGSVASAVGQGRFPIVLAGGCISAVGTLAGLNTEDIGIIWLDAHGDFNTPDTSVSGFIDGMALASATGRCWRNLLRSIDGFGPVREKNVILIGARDLDEGERQLLEDSEITQIGTESIRQRGVQRVLETALKDIPAEHVYLHIDLDVLDREEARVNEFSSPRGLQVTELLEIVRSVRELRSLAAAAITAYDPSYDRDGKALSAASALLNELQSSALHPCQVKGI